MSTSIGIRPTPHKRQPFAPAPARLAPRFALHDPAELLRSGPSSMPRRWAKKEPFGLFASDVGLVEPNLLSGGHAIGAGSRAGSGMLEIWAD